MPSDKQILDWITHQVDVLGKFILHSPSDVADYAIPGLTSTARCDAGTVRKSLAGLMKKHPIKVEKVTVKWSKKNVPARWSDRVKFT